MKILNSKTLENGDEEFEIELSEDEKKLIKEVNGWKKLTNARIQNWFNEMLVNFMKEEIKGL
jgi:hypothetical protein